MKFFALLGAIFVSVLISCNASAIYLDSFSTVKFPTGREDEFSENNIIFYNPEAKTDACRGGGECSIRGDTLEEKLWSGLRGLGFTPEETSAIMGNILHEGGSPVRQEDCYNIARDKGYTTKEGNPYTIHTNNDQHHGSGMPSISGCECYSYGEGVAGIGLGFVQWTSQDRREGYLEIVDGLGMSDYFEGDAYKKWGRLTDAAFREKVVEETGSETDYWNIWCAALKYIKQELDDGYKNFYNQGSVKEMAKWFAAHYEICDGCGESSSGNLSRQNKAEEIYTMYQNGDFDTVESGGGSTVTSSSTTTSEDGTNVTIIGDSIMNASKSEVQKVLPKAEFLSVQDGKKFSGNDSSNPSGLSVLNDASSVRKILVFALGSNGGVSEEKVNEVITRAKEIGAQKIIFATLFSRGSKDYTASNTLFKSKAGTDVILMDWESAVSSDPEKYIRIDSDGVDVHPTSPDGTELYAKTLLSAIASASTTSKCGPTGDVAALQEKTKAYAWPQYHSAPYPDQMPDYAEAVKSAWYIGGCNGNDCGGFVTTLVRDSGWDEDYNPSKCGTGCQQEYLRSSEKWEDVTDQIHSDDDFKPGDVLIYNSGDHGHTLIFVGEISGFDSKFASASYAGQNASCQTGSYARSPMADRGNYNSYNDGVYHFYRKTN